MDSPADQTPDRDSPAFDPGILVSAVSSYLLGEMPHLTGPQVAAQAGVPYDVAKERWRALGFPEVSDDEASFTQSDVQALRLTQKLFEYDVVEPDAQTAFVRTTGRTFARLAEWQARAFMRGALDEPVDGNEEEPTGDTRTDETISLKYIDEIVPLTEQIQSFVWRRHLVSATSRLLLRESAETSTTPVAVGFVDIVGYTSRSRRLSPGELAQLIEDFEAVIDRIITEHHGQVIKTIGDEILFVSDDPVESARMALAMVDQHESDNEFPQVRVGMAYGHVLSRLGDVYGPVVNVASRLTSIAKRGRIVIDRALADSLGEQDWLRIRRMRRTSVKGYEHLEPWSLKRPRDQGNDEHGEQRGLRETIEDVVEDTFGQAAGGSSRFTRRGKPDDKPDDDAS